VTRQAAAPLHSDDALALDQSPGNGAAPLPSRIVVLAIKVRSIVPSQAAFTIARGPARGRR